MKKYSFLIIILTAILLGCSKEDFQWDLDKVDRLPAVRTLNTNNIFNTGAIINSEVINEGGSTVTQRGVCWSANENPTIANNTTNDGTGTGSFTSSITGLSSNTSYYVRAYAINGVGTTYGNQLNFTTTNSSGSIPILTTTSVSGITGNSAASGGDITSDGGSTVTQRGVCWSTSSNPTIANDITNDGSSMGSFTSSITGLSSNTSYYVRAYAINGIGTAYGNQVNFTTNFQNVSCNITSSTTGTNYSVTSPTQSVFNSGDSYTITLYSPIYSFGQASSVELYLDENQVFSLGTWLNFPNNTRTFILPTVATTSNCYTLRVFKASDIYISTPFTIY